jgi:predicted acetyltransferase
MSIDIRPITDEELPAFVEALTTGFLERPDPAPLTEVLRELWDLSRTWAAFDDGRIVATFRTWPTELTVPGLARLPADAIAAVTVLPTHRRQGILRRMVTAEHAAARERGEAVGLLYASEYPIYGRFGYGVACQQAEWSVAVDRTTFHGETTGRLEIAPADVATRDALVAVFEAWRHRQPGEIARRDNGWDFDLGLRPEVWGESWKGFVVLHRDPTGEVDGYARYHADGKWEQRQPRNTLVVDDLHALTPEAHADLWRFLADIDWVAVVRAERRPPSERLPWLLTNARAATITEGGDGLFAHLLDVPGALAARTYEHEADVVLEVIDPLAPDGRWRVALDAGPHGATCAATDRSPDLTVHASALGAAYLGGSRLRDAVIAFGADEHTTGALERVDALFRTSDEPWCSTFF